MAAKPVTRGPGGISYPWDKWFDKERVTLKPGTHFHCTTKSMIWMTRHAAKLRGIEISIKSLEDGAFRVTVHE